MSLILNVGYHNILLSNLTMASHSSMDIVLHLEASSNSAISFYSFILWRNSS